MPIDLIKPVLDAVRNGVAGGQAQAGEAEEGEAEELDSGEAEELSSSEPRSLGPGVAEVLAGLAPESAADPEQVEPESEGNRSTE